MAAIAIIGSGISGLLCAYLLNREHEVTLFESNDYLGGHTHTHTVMVDSEPVKVDTGFIVYNDRSYPHFMQLLAHLGCEGKPTEMSFSVKHPTANLEYNGHSLNSLFAQRRNLFRPGFYRMMWDILRFNKLARNINASDPVTLGAYLEQHGFSAEFCRYYILPMAAAIWSSGEDAVQHFPIRALAAFFANHGLLDLKNRPQWYVVKGGSHTYVQAMLPDLGNYRLNSPVLSVRRDEKFVEITSKAGAELFDEVVFANHSNQALSLLQDPTRAEQQVLSNIEYTLNKATLHTDATVLPSRARAWASWNYYLSDSKPDKATLTYNMNILQGIRTKSPVLVTLNSNRIDAKKIIAEYEYAHPHYNQATLDAQQRHAEISGLNRSHYCGAYWFDGFHEDGVRSALRVCENFNVSL
ncbi:MAG: putative NAD/FAD-binding protein [Candidatus Azotimanducaceae bacterium]|jgi:predicted NAD/FAD-binding protein